MGNMETHAYLFLLSNLTSRFFYQFLPTSLHFVSFAISFKIPALPIGKYIDSLLKNAIVSNVR